MNRFSLAAALALAGCMTQDGLTQSQEADRRALAEARPVGEPEDCVILNRIRATRVRDGSTIDFELVDGRTLRNRLPQSCPGLAFEERFSYRTSLTRLCSVDTITVLHADGGRGASCGLGTFQPVEIPRR